MSLVSPLTDCMLFTPPKLTHINLCVDPQAIVYPNAKIRVCTHTIAHIGRLLQSPIQVVSVCITFSPCLGASHALASIIERQSDGPRSHFDAREEGCLWCCHNI